jgi:hypothetical protein
VQQRQRPTRVRVAQLLGAEDEEGLQQVQVVFVQQRRSPPPFFLLERGGVEGLRVGGDPVVDALPGDTQHAGDVGRGAAGVKLQDGQGAPEQACIVGFLELTTKPLPLPRGQLEPAHVLLLHR